MPSPTIANGPVKLPDAANTDVTKQTLQPAEKLTPQADAHTQLNASIIEASIQVSIQSKTGPLRCY